MMHRLSNSDDNLDHGFNSVLLNSTFEFNDYIESQLPMLSAEPVHNLGVNISSTLNQVTNGRCTQLEQSYGIEMFNNLHMDEIEKLFDKLKCHPSINGTSKHNHISTNRLENWKPTETIQKDMFQFNASPTVGAVLAPTPGPTAELCTYKHPAKFIEQIKIARFYDSPSDSPLEINLIFSIIASVGQYTLENKGGNALISYRPLSKWASPKSVTYLYCTRCPIRIPISDLSRYVSSKPQTHTAEALSQLILLHEPQCNSRQYINKLTSDDTIKPVEEGQLRSPGTFG
jgi:hypothetical protein